MQVPFQQHRCTDAIEALYAAPLTQCDTMRLAKTSELASAFSLAIECLPKLSNRLTACAVFAQLCCVELNEGSEQGAHVHPFCSEFAEKGDFLILHASLAEAVEVRVQRLRNVLKLPTA